ncbi:hypothetical protein Pmani_004368 [Petrolisthes manimaculis]|uniref:Alpha-macroglobulin receptor-binding domain-containing protein n=1 Tax=Petrolisthes manimaculis TaxID=1843537 RepID=A0AAE1QEU6_9EUCA|nr:hypothetical protein Pmani_004368 [Petrolisthes manimaculis]
MALDPRGYDQPARKVIKWITAQRNGGGGFYSSQYQADVNLVATVKRTDLHHSFTVDETNKLLTQLVPLPGLSNTFHLSIVGQGCAVLQSVLRYNIIDAEVSDAFILSVGTNTEADKNCVTKNVEACVTYEGAKLWFAKVLPDGKSNMVVMEVNLISGYIPDKEDLKAIVSANNTIKSCNPIKPSANQKPRTREAWRRSSLIGPPTAAEKKKEKRTGIIQQVSLKTERETIHVKRSPSRHESGGQTKWRLKATPEDDATSKDWSVKNSQQYKMATAAAVAVLIQATDTTHTDVINLC